MTWAITNPFQKAKTLPCFIPQSLRNLQRFLSNESIRISTKGSRRPFLALCLIQEIRAVVHVVSLKLKPLDPKPRDIECLGFKRVWSSRTGSIEYPPDSCDLTPRGRFSQHRGDIMLCSTYDENLCKLVLVIKPEHIVHMREQPLDPFEQGKILEFNRELIPQKSILNSEAHCTLFFNILAQELQRDVFGRHGYPAVLYVHSRGACSVFFRTGLRVYAQSRQAPQTQKDQEKQKPWMPCLNRVIHEAFLAWTMTSTFFCAQSSTLRCCSTYWMTLSERCLFFFKASAVLSPASLGFMGLL